MTKINITGNKNITAERLYAWVKEKKGVKKRWQCKTKVAIKVNEKKAKSAMEYCRKTWDKWDEDIIRRTLFQKGCTTLAAFEKLLPEVDKLEKKKLTKKQ